MRVVYVGGAGRSGSTLLERLLGELPRVCALGEVTQLWDRVGRRDVRCGCGRWFAECRFWTEVGDRAFGGWHRVDLRRIPRLQRAVARTRQLPGLAGPWTGHRAALLAEYAHYYAQVYAAAAAVADAEVVIDSSKNPALAYSLRCSGAVDLRVVHLVRDPRGVAYSWSRQLAGAERRAGSMMLQMPPLRSALQWNAHNLALDLLSRLGRRSGGTPGCRVPVRRLRYEDLLADPPATVATLAEFFGVRVDGAELAFLARDRAWLNAQHGVAGNPMRFTTGTVPLRRDDVWRTALPTPHRRLVSTVCAPLLVAYGYPLSTGRPQ